MTGHPVKIEAILRCGLFGGGVAPQDATPAAPTRNSKFLTALDRPPEFGCGFAGSNHRKEEL
jgi:hypothetical protein